MVVFFKIPSHLAYPLTGTGSKTWAPVSRTATGYLPMLTTIELNMQHKHSVTLEKDSESHDLSKCEYASSVNNIYFKFLIPHTHVSFCIPCILFGYNVIMIYFTLLLVPIMSKLSAMHVSFYAHVHTQHLDKLGC